MPDYVRDLIDKEEKKKNESIVDRLKRALGAKDYKEELPHSEEHSDKPWEKVKKSSKEVKAEDFPGLSAEDEKRAKEKDDEAISHIAELEAEKERKKKEEIARRVGGWSKK